MSIVRTQEFLEVLETADVTKDEPYEELFYSRDEDLNVKYTREGARYYYEDEALFERENESTFICKQDIDLGTGYEDYTFFSRTKYTNANVKGTKYIGLIHYEKSRNKKVDADMIVSRHTLIDCLYVFLNKTRFNHCVVYSDGQIFFESSRSISPSIDRATMTGYNFEELMTSCTKNKEREFEFVPPKNNAVKYNSMVIHKFPTINTKVLVSCEIDAIKEDPEELKLECDSPFTFKRSILRNYVELKAKASPSVQKKMYLQCYLAGTKNLIIGVKDKDLILKKVVKHDLSTYSSEKLSPVILNKWFAFITQFIKMTIKRYARKYRKGLYKMVIYPKEDVLKIYPFGLTSEEKDLVVIPKFLDWREQLRNPNKTSFDNISIDLEHLSISNPVGKEKIKKRRRGKKKAKNTDSNSIMETNSVVDLNRKLKETKKEKLVETSNE